MPKGYKDIKKYGFKSSRDKPLVAKISIRVTEEMALRLRATPDYAEKIRELIQDWLDSEDNQDSQDSPKP